MRNLRAAGWFFASFVLGALTGLAILVGVGEFGSPALAHDHLFDLVLGYASVSLWTVVLSDRWDGVFK